MAKETYYTHKRNLQKETDRYTGIPDSGAKHRGVVVKCQKRPTIWQKRPIIRTKETYRYTGIPDSGAKHRGVVGVERDGP